MGESLATQLLRSDDEVACSTCGYPIWVRYSEIVAQAAVTCPCCFTQVWLVDQTGSAQNAGEVIEQQIAHALKGLFR